MPDGGMGYRATYQVAGQPEVVMEFKKKQEISVSIRRRYHWTINGQTSRQLPLTRVGAA